jgi:DNA-binding MltR family transcriptional regulator
MLKAPTSEDYAKYDAFAKEFETESDRAAAILAGAYLDARLSETLQEFLVDDPETLQLLSENGPLGTFGARSHLAFSLGFLRLSSRKDLKLIGRIRNRFAHEEGNLTFSSSPIREWCHDLNVVKFVREEAGPDHPLLRDPPLQFLASVHFAMVHLRTAVREPRRTLRAG